MTELAVIHAEGDPFRRGVTVGAKLADGHLRAVDFMHRYTRRHGLNDADLERLLAPYVQPPGTQFPIW